MVSGFFVVAPFSGLLKLNHLPILGDSFSLEDYLKDAREDVIRKALDQCKGNQSAAARMLGISPQAVSKFLKAHPDS